MMEEDKPASEEAREEKHVEVETEVRRPRRRYRSFFWPVLLIGLGTLWLLTNLDVIGSENLAVLFRLWPLVLIVIGLDLLVGRASPLLGTLIGVGAVAAIVALVIVGPALGLGGEGVTLLGLPVTFDEDFEIKSETFSTPLDGASAAEVDLDLGFERTEIDALSGSDDLIVADLDYVGEIDFEARGGNTKQVRLDEHEVEFSFFGPFDFSGDDILWEIGLSPDVAMDLRLDGGSGPVEADLSALDLTDLRLDGGSGPFTASLPGGSYAADVDSGSGPLTLSLEDEADVAMRLDSGSGPVRLTVGDESNFEVEIDAGSGPVTVDVPDGAAVRVVAEDDGSGPLTVPASLTMVDDGDDDERETGTWQSPDFDDADFQIVIVLDSAGSGPVAVR